jgi:dipeptidyl aminopeptidase/acylaminoacyl peptidase
MRYVLVQVIFFLIFGMDIQALYCQNKIIDYNACQNWPRIDKQMISNNGDFLTYRVFTKSSLGYFVIQSTKSSWQRTLKNASDLIFTNNSKYLLYRIGDDTLSILDLSSDTIEEIEHIQSFKLQNTGDKEWLAYTINSTNRLLKLRNLQTKQESTFENIDTYLFTQSGNALITKCINISGEAKITELRWLDLSDRHISNVYTGNDDISTITSDQRGSQLVFFLKSTRDGIMHNSIHYYKIGMNSSELKVDDQSVGMDSMILSDRLPEFRNNDSSLFFYIRSVDTLSGRPQKPDISKVDVWSWKDKKLNSEQNVTPWNSSFLAAIALHKKDAPVIKLQYIDEIYPQGWCNSKYVLIFKKISNYVQDFYLVSIEDGSRQFVTRSDGYNIMISPYSKYVLWYDYKQRNWFTYNTSSKTIENITKKISEPTFTEDDRSIYPASEGMLGWLPFDNFVLIYGRQHLWKIDPASSINPQNITGEYKLSKSVRFRGISKLNGNALIKSLDSLILLAFDTKSKEKGFFQVNEIGGSKYALTKLFLGTIGTRFPSPMSEAIIDILGLDFPIIPIKAVYENAYILDRMSDDEYPNLYFTSDFVAYKRLTDFSPQKDFRWYTNELMHWKLPDDSIGDGMLFKPQDFNPHKKYPVIFYCYEKSSCGFNLFIHPELSNGAMSIPWFTSREYLVFVPDIKFRMGYVGESAFNSITSAAKFLSKYSWVDKNRMGLQGHSFGGWETNFVITKTNLFKAAASAAGVVNVLSSYGEPLLYSDNKHSYYEYGQGRMSAPFWMKKELYLSNSPIINAEKIKTPLLIMHNKRDASVNWSQAYEFFTALYSMNKNVYMLQYDGESHTISDSVNQLDYSTRLTQFFNFHLKGENPPRWMSQGLPAFEKGINDGLEVDSLYQSKVKRK